jgi:hypothetical protein
MAVAPISTLDDRASFPNLAGDPAAFQNAIKSPVMPDSGTFPASSYTPQIGSSPPFQSTFYDPSTSQSQDQDQRIMKELQQILSQLQNASGSNPGSSSDPGSSQSQDQQIIQELQQILSQLQNASGSDPGSSQSQAQQIIPELQQILSQLQNASA